MVIGSEGYEPVLEVILDTVTLTSSMNDYQLLSAESCSVRSEFCDYDLITHTFLYRFEVQCLPLSSGTVKDNGTFMSASANLLCTSLGSISTCLLTLVRIG